MLTERYIEVKTRLLEFRADALEIALTQESCYILITEHFPQEVERTVIARARFHPIPPFCASFAEIYRNPVCAAFYLV